MRCCSFFIACLCATAAIRPTFSLSSASWDATEIVVLERATEPGSFRVVESVKGSTQPGTVIALPELFPEPERARAFDRVVIEPGSFLEPGTAVPPILGPTDRILVFLKQLGTKPAGHWNDWLTSAVWIHHTGRVYGFVQISPWPTHFVKLYPTERMMRTAMHKVLDLRASFDRAVADPDPNARASQLAALVDSQDTVVSYMSLERLKITGDAAARAALWKFLDDSARFPRHWQFLEALKSATEEDYGRFEALLNTETSYWTKTCPLLQPNWWNTPNSEESRTHYSRVHSILRAITGPASTALRESVGQFSEVWRTCPSIDGIPQSRDQVTHEVTRILSY